MSLKSGLPPPNGVLFVEGGVLDEGYDGLSGSAGAAMPGGLPVGVSKTILLSNLIELTVGAV